MNNFLICTPAEHANALPRSRARVRAWGRVPGERAVGAGAGLPEAQLARKGALGFGRREICAAGDMRAGS